VQVLINQERVDVTLENEKTLGEVVHGIRTWLNESQLYITDVTVDEQGVALDAPDSWADTSIEDVDRIEISALPPWQVKSAGLQLLTDYFSYLADAIRNGKQENIAELATEAPNVASSLPLYARDLVDTENRDDIFSRIVDAPEILEGRLPDGPRSEELLGYLDQAVTVLRGRLREVASPVTESAATAETIRTLIPEMNEMSVLLQRGEDAKAMDLIVRFTELIAKLLRIVPHVERETDDPTFAKDNLEPYGEELNTTLGELVEAFNAQDSVLIGDLVEYELVPKIEELLEQIPRGEGDQSR
jgi:hypothetical protein